MKTSIIALTILLTSFSSFATETKTEQCSRISADVQHSIEYLYTLKSEFHNNTENLEVQKTYNNKYQNFKGQYEGAKNTCGTLLKVYL